MATNLAAIRDFLLPGLNTIFGDYDQLETQFDQIFEKNVSDMAYERDVEVKLLGLAQVRNEGEATAFEDMGERYVSVYRPTGYALGFIMTKFAIRDNLYQSQFGPNTKALKNSLKQTKEVYCAAVLNNATNASFVGGDGQPLLSTAHPTDVGTYANTPTVQAQLNETSLQQGVVAVRRFKDVAGLRASFKVKKLVVAPENQWVAKRIFGTELRIGTTDNDTNAIRDLREVPGGYVVNDFLTDTNAFYLITDCPNGLRFFQRDPMEVDMHTDFVTDSLMVKATERFSAGWSNARGIYGSMP